MQSCKLPMRQLLYLRTTATHFQLLIPSLTAKQFSVVVLLLIVLKFPGTNCEPVKVLVKREAGSAVKIKVTPECNDFCEKRFNPSAKYFKNSSVPGIGFIIKCLEGDSECDAKCDQECVKVCSKTTDDTGYTGKIQQINCPFFPYTPTDGAEPRGYYRRRGRYYSDSYNDSKSECNETWCIILAISFVVIFLIIGLSICIARCVVASRRAEMMMPPQTVIHPGGAVVAGMNNQVAAALPPQPPPSNPGLVGY